MKRNVQYGNARAKPLKWNDVWWGTQNWGWATGLFSQMKVNDHRFFSFVSNGDEMCLPWFKTCATITGSIKLN